MLFSWSGSLECELWTGGRGALNQHLFRVTSSTYPKWFYYFWIKHHLPTFRHIAAAKATTMGHIQRGHLTEARVVLPQRELLQKATRHLDPLIEALIARRLQARNIECMRDLLVPKLISGAIEVHSVDALLHDPA